MQKRTLVVLAVVLTLSVAGFAAPAAKSAGGPDKAYLQKVMDGWSTLDPANVAAYYASGPHTFFDVAPLKYGSWAEYQVGVTKALAGYKSGKFTVNDDADIHQGGNFAWSSATVKEELTSTAGKHEMATLRWTAVWEKQNGKWLIVHEHVSVPEQ